MPDSFPPFGWGPAPFDERDLDALLSGERYDISPQLRPVADALSALCAPPARSELSGEAMIMAEFSALAEFRAFGLSEAERDDGLSHTLVLPVLPSDAAPRRGARHRNRRPTRQLGWRMGAVMGAAAAAAIVTVVAFAGNGPLRQLSPTSATHPAASTGTQSVAAKGAATEPPARPSNQAPAHSLGPQPSSSPDPSKLCRDWAGNFQHQQGHSKRAAAEAVLFGQLSELAGGGGLPRVVAYCWPYMQDMFPHGWNFPDNPGGQGNSGSDGQGPGAPVQGNSATGNPASPGQRH